MLFFFSPCDTCTGSAMVTPQTRVLAPPYLPFHHSPDMAALPTSLSFNFPDNFREFMPYYLFSRTFVTFDPQRPDNVFNDKLPAGFTFENRGPRGRTLQGKLSSHARDSIN